MNDDISNLKNVTVLYVEDEKELRELTHSVLKSFTKKQFVAQNGQEGYDLFLENELEIDLIISDVHMPVLNGLDMIKKIKEINKKIPVIITTAFSDTKHLLDAIDIGVDKYILKPVDIQKLLNAMTQSLNYRELKDLYTDALTNLSNKNKLLKDLQERDDTSLIAIVGIDNFFAINDLFGETIIDKILKKFAHKMRTFLDLDEYCLYRLETDKFAIVAKNSIEVDEFFNTCKTFLKQIEDQVFLIDENEIDINITIGIAQGEREKAYQNARRIIGYARKEYTKIMLYDDSYNIHKHFEENIKWIKQLKQGFKDNLLKAYFQPIVNTQTKEIVKYEALIRYISPENIEFGPYSFLHIVKKTKMYPNIIKVVLNDALKLIKNKNKQVSINISYKDVLNERTTEYIYSFLEKNKEFASNFEFELLESEEILDFAIINNFIEKVSSYGCIVGIDDFGAGYSNFYLLSFLNINFIKIDGSLIKNIQNSKDFEIIVKTILDIAKNFNIKTVAEFVANEDIYNKVKELDIDLSQGYYLDKPLTYEQIE